jgi:hypothetical protein
LTEWASFSSEECFESLYNQYNFKDNKDYSNQVNVMKCLAKVDNKAFLKIFENEHNPILIDILLPKERFNWHDITKGY